MNSRAQLQVEDSDSELAGRPVERTSAQGSRSNDAAQSKTRKKSGQAEENSGCTVSRRRDRARTNPISAETPGPPLRNREQSKTISDFSFVNGPGTMINDNVGNIYNITTKWWVGTLRQKILRSKLRLLVSNPVFEHNKGTASLPDLSDSSSFFKLPGHQRPPFVPWLRNLDRIACNHSCISLFNPRARLVLLVKVLLSV